jgi:hypothetical protein
MAFSLYRGPVLERRNIMSFFSWLASAIGKRQSAIGSGLRKPKAGSRKPPRFRPQLEALEDRWMPSHSHGTSTLMVTNNYDDGSGSLRYEIAQAQSNDTIVFNNVGGNKHAITPETITLTSGELVISKNLTIVGPGITITSSPYINGAFDQSNGSRIFEVDGASTSVAISGLTLTNGGGTLLIGVFNGHSYDGYGGAILNFGTLTISNCSLGTDSINSGSDAYYGGAIANFGTMTISGCYVQNNSAWGTPAEGGGIYNAGVLTVSSSYVESNSAPGGGGGIYNAGAAAALTVLDSIFSHNGPDNISGPYTDGGGNTFS